MMIPFRSSERDSVQKKLFYQPIFKKEKTMSKYNPLTNYLLANCNKKTVELNFDFINSLIYPHQLPASAYIYREWWANDRYHSQANAWYNAGFLVSTVSTRTVVFINKDIKRNPIISNRTDFQTKIIDCPICKKRFDNRSINNHICHEENKYFGNYIRFQTSNFVCGICFGIIKDFSLENLQAHKDKKCLDKEYMKNLKIKMNK